MYRILWNGQSAMNANQTKLDAISNNIVNVATPGYKKVDVEFKDSLKESLDRKGYPTNVNGGYTGTGVRAAALTKQFYQGSLLDTGLKTDFGLDGRSMFKVINSDGQELYTRNGSFMVDVNGDIVDSMGNMLEIEYEPEYLNLKRQGKASLKGGNFIVDKNGDIGLKIGEEFKVIGKIPLYAAEGSDPYISVGESMFLPKPDAQMQRTKDTQIHQGLLEGSNVDIGQEFSDMIMTQRAFQLGSKSIQTADEMWGMVNNMRSK
ncbi:MAG: flagellar hook-basal body complex protein [Sarcina sp.]